MSGNQTFDFDSIFATIDSVTTKDGKTLKGAFVQFLTNFPLQMAKLFEDMKAEFHNSSRIKDEAIEKLQEDNKALHARVEKLEEQLDDQSAYERRDTLIISGKSIPTATPNENVSEIVCKVAHDVLHHEISASDISVAHRIGPKPLSQRPDNRKIIVKLCRRDVKSTILGAARRMKSPDLFVNESLTPQRQTISFALRRAKKRFPSKISGTTTTDGRVFVYVKPMAPETSSARDTRLQINTFTQLENFCQRTFGLPMDQFILRNQ